MSIDLQVWRKTTEETAKELKMDCCTGVSAERTYYSYVNHLRYNVEAGQKIHYSHIHLYIPNGDTMTVKVWDRETKKRVKVVVKAKIEDLMSIYTLVNLFQRGKIGKRRNNGNKVCDYCRRLGLPGTCQIKGLLDEINAIAEIGVEK